MLPDASTLMRHVLLVTGVYAVTVSVPSFGTWIASGVQLLPPSVDSRMFTNGATLPPPTVHVTGNGVPDASVLPPFGEVSTNGAPLTVISVESHAEPPTPRWLSRTVSPNFI